MPNPYKGNDKAAYHVQYYASNRMLQDSVYRLHNQAITERTESIERVEKDIYPEQPHSYRSTDEINHYLERRVAKEMLRRQQRRTARERELYPERFCATNAISPDKLHQQIERLYTPATPSRKIEYHSISHRDPVTGKRCETDQNSKGSKNRHAERAVWKPSYSAPNQGPLEPPPHHRPLALPADKRDERLRALSKPLHVTPRAESHTRSDSPQPLFQVPRRIVYKD